MIGDCCGMGVLGEIGEDCPDPELSFSSKVPRSRSWLRSFEGAVLALDTDWLDGMSRDLIHV